MLRFVAVPLPQYITEINMVAIHVTKSEINGSQVCLYTYEFFQTLQTISYIQQLLYVL